MCNDGLRKYLVTHSIIKDSSKTARSFDRNLFFFELIEANFIVLHVLPGELHFCSCITVICTAITSTLSLMALLSSFIRSKHSII